MVSESVPFPVLYKLETVKATIVVTGEVNAPVGVPEITPVVVLM